ncbi:MAG: metal ABC transporter substrate-binding protein [Oscillospiraceae bacterium]|nr:metal ABC transporter substrate-binding protein [Oscillospiraceae bacterium]
MKKRTLKTSAILSALALSAALLTGCGVNAEAGSDAGSDTGNLIRVGVCAGPYEDMFKDGIQPQLEAKGYTIKYVDFSDYVQPNNALAENEIDANIFQHSTYLKNFSQEHGLDLTYITEIPTAAMGIFSDKFDSIENIEEGAAVAIPNDDTNLARALRVLEQTGIITLDPGIDPSQASVKDISENPKSLTFTEVSAEILPTVLDSVGVAVINGNYALSAGLDLADAIYIEALSEGYYNVIAVRTADADKDFAKDITAAVHSDEFRSVIEDTSKQYSAFNKPAAYND